MHTNQLSNTNNQQWTRIGSRKKNRTKPSEQENYFKKKIWPDEQEIPSNQSLVSATHQQISCLRLSLSPEIVALQFTTLGESPQILCGIFRVRSWKLCDYYLQDYNILESTIDFYKNVKKIDDYLWIIPFSIHEIYCFFFFKGIFHIILLSLSISVHVTKNGSADQASSLAAEKMRERKWNLKFEPGKTINFLGKFCFHGKENKRFGRGDEGREYGKAKIK